MVSLKGYIIRRIIGFIPFIFSVMVINFVIMQLAPGDVAIYLAGEEASPEYVAYIRQLYGLDKPIFEQFAIYLSHILHGDLGISYVYNRPVISVIAERLPYTILLVFSAWVLAAVTGTLTGAYSAKKPNSRMDVALSAFSIVTYSIPVFWLGLILIFLFAIKIPLFPTSGITTYGSGIFSLLDLLWHSVLPVVTLSLVMFGQYMRIARASVIDVMREDFITTARAVGHSENTVFLKHALRNALLPTVTLAGLQLVLVFSGAVLTETVFSWPGMGTLIYHAIGGRDFPLVTGSYIIVSCGLALAMLITDIIYAFLDPRIRYK